MTTRDRLATQLAIGSVAFALLGVGLLILALLLSACSPGSGPAGAADAQPSAEDAASHSADAASSPTDADPVTPRRIVAILGQSNAVGGARTLDATIIDDAVLNEPYPQVTLAQLLSTDETFVEFPADALQPRLISHRIGCEITLGYELDATWGDVDIVKVGDSGTSLDGAWKPSAEIDYPIARDYLRTQEEALGGDVVAVVWIQGNGDAREPTGAAAGRYQENLTALHGQLLADFPEVGLFALDRYPFEGDYRDEVRAAQLAFVDATPETAWVDADDLPQRGDGDHYAADGFITLGRRFAVVIAP